MLNYEDDLDDEIIDFGSEVEDDDEVIGDTLFFDEVDDDYDEETTIDMMFPNDEDGEELEDYIMDDW